MALACIGGTMSFVDQIAQAAERENAFGLLGSLNMLLATPGGFDFTGADCQAWMRETGFSQTRVEPLTDTVSMVVAIK